MANNNFNEDIALDNSFKKFDGYYTNIYKDSFVSGNAFMFITKPLLYINPIKSTTTSLDRSAYINMTRDPNFAQYITTEALNNIDRYIPQMLSYNLSNTNVTSLFMPIFTNACKSFDSNDIAMGQTELFDTKQGHRQSLPTHKTESEAANTLSITVTEDNNLSFTKIMNLWVNYISNITDGTFDANPEMVLNGVLDYTCSIFYFVLEPDGKTLKYWAKYTGCWPTSIPYGSFRYTKGDNSLVDLNLTFAYSVKEDMNPLILEDFNKISLKLNDTYVPSVSRDGYYNTIVESPLLNRNIMPTAIESSKLILASEERDPLIFCSESYDVNKKFELIFGKSAYTSSVTDNVIKPTEDSYTFNMFDIFESYQEK